MVFGADITNAGAKPADAPRLKADGIFEDAHVLAAPAPSAVAEATVDVTLDELPIGGSSGFSVAEFAVPEFPDEVAGDSAPEAADTRPVEVRIKDKDWKTRAKAYDGLNTALTGDDEEAAAHAASTFNSNAGAIVGDTNAAAQEKGLTVLESAISGHLAKLDGTAVVSACAGPIIEKALVGRPGAKKSAALCLQAFVRAGLGGATVHELVARFSHKQPRVAAAAVAASRDLVERFGPKATPVKGTLLDKATLSQLFAHADKNVRKEAVALTGELYCWVKDAITPMLEGLKLAQRQELSDSFVLLIDVSKAPLEAPLATSSAKSGPGGGGAKGKKADGSQQAAAGAAAAAAECDDLIEPVDVLAAMPRDWTDKLSKPDTKWKVKKELLDAVTQSCGSAPRIKPGGDYTDPCRVLKRLITEDSNILVVVSAIKALAALARGLRRDFGPHAKRALPVLMDKLKEKKASVTEAVASCMNTFVTDGCFGIGEVADDVAAFTDETKNRAWSVPKVKSDTLAWVAAAAQVSSSGQAGVKPLSAKQARTLSELSNKLVDHPTPLVRDSALCTLAALFTATGGEAGPVHALVSQLEDKKSKKLYALHAAATQGNSTVKEGSAAPAPAASEEASSSAAVQATLTPTAGNASEPVAENTYTMATEAAAVSTPAAATALMASGAETFSSSPTQLGMKTNTVIVEGTPPAAAPATPAASGPAAPQVAGPFPYIAPGSALTSAGRGAQWDARSGSSLNKVGRWLFEYVDASRAEFVDGLKSQIAGEAHAPLSSAPCTGGDASGSTLVGVCMAANTATLLFSEDFKLQMEGLRHVAATLRDTKPVQVKQGLATTCGRDRVLAQRDLIFKWASLQLSPASPNTTVAIKLLALFQEILQAGQDADSPDALVGGCLSDYELHILLPCLIKTSGSNRDTLRQTCKGIYSKLMQACTSTAAAPALSSLPKRMLGHFSEALRSSKNSRVRLECLDQFAAVVERCGLEPLGALGKAVPFLAGYIADTDAKVREAALGCMTACHRRIVSSPSCPVQGGVLSIIPEGALPPKERGLLEERIRRLNNAAAASTSLSSCVPVPAAAAPVVESTLAANVAEPQQQAAPTLVEAVAAPIPAALAPTADPSAVAEVTDPAAAADVVSVAPVQYADPSQSMMHESVAVNRSQQATASAAVAGFAPPANTNMAAKQRLVGIFKRIGNREEAEAAMSDLYSFTVEFPDLDIYAYLKSTSEFFKTYIRNGLARLQTAQAAASATAAPSDEVY